MKFSVRSLGQGAITLAAVAGAAAVGWWLWIAYIEAPWTRDGHVRADVVGVSPDVTGLVAEVLVRDNEVVKRGQVLVRVDRARFELALRMAEAQVSARRASFEESAREAARYAQLNSLSVSEERQQQTATAQQTSAAAYQQAMVDRDTAQLNLNRTEITAPEAGTVSNFTLRAGDYVAAGRPVLALVATDSLHIEGYFEETKLPRIHPGDPVRIRLVGERTDLTGRVQSIASGIEDRERGAGASGLANVNPTFAWVRLAQRIPVRVTLDKVPDDVRLIAGRTATVEVLSGRATR